MRRRRCGIVFFKGFSFRNSWYRFLWTAIKGLISVFDLFAWQEFFRVNRPHIKPFRYLLCFLLLAKTKLSVVRLLESEHSDLLAFVCAYLALLFFLCVCLLAYKIWGVPKYVSHSKSSADLMIALFLLERKIKNRNHVHY